MKLSLWKRVAGTVVAVLITGCATVGPIDRPVVSVSRDVALAEIPGLSANVFAAQGTLVQIEDPVLYVPDQTIPFEGFYFFSVRILNTNAFEGEQTEFDVVGGPERLNSFISQVKFVTEEHGGWGETTLAGLRGARDDLKGMVDGIAQLLFHPIESAKLMKDGGGAAVDYMKKMYHGEVSLRADAGRFLEAYAENVYESEAQRFGFSFQDIQIPEAKDAVVRMGRAKMTGMAATELAVLMVAWLKISKVTEAAKIGQAAGKASVASQGASGGGTLTKAGAWGPAFSYAVHAEQGAARAAAAASIAARAKPLEMLRPLLQPSKIATLKGGVALNGRMHQIMYWLRKAEMEGHDVSETLTRGMKMAGADKRFSGTLLDRRIDHPQLLENYRILKQTGAFDDVENLDRMRRRLAPYVDLAGKRTRLDVDHIVPRRDAPELANVWGNLRYLPNDLHVARGPKPGKAFMDLSMSRRLSDYRNAGLISQDRVNEILRATLLMPAR